MSLSVKVFSSNNKSVGDVCEEAAEFATSLGPERLASISHSNEGSRVVVVVWYWVHPNDA